MTLDFEQLFGSLPTAYLVMTSDLVIAEVNTAYLELMGHTRDELVGVPVFEAFPPSRDTLADNGGNPLRVSFERVRDTGRTEVLPVLKYDVRDPVTGAHQQRYWSLVHCAVDVDGGPPLVLQCVEDVTDYLRAPARDDLDTSADRDWKRRIEDVQAQLLRRMQQLKDARDSADLALRALKATEQRARAVLDTAADAIITFDADGRMESVNRAAEAMFGFAADHLVGRNVSMLMLDQDDTAWRRTDSPIPGQRVGSNEREAVGRRRDGSTFPIQLAVSSVGTEPPLFAAVARDMTDRRRLEDQLRHQSVHDPLTGLPNRMLLMERLEAVSLHLARCPGLLGLFFVDLDRFKMVNDSLGHEAGDAVLRQTADRIRSAVRPEDLVARIGGDEFVIVCGDLKDRSEAEAVARRLVKTLGVPLYLRGQELYVTASVGLVTDDGSRAVVDLIGDADAAMYQAKQQGRARFSVVDDTARTTSHDRLMLSGQLHHALEREEMRAHYQPLVDLGSEQVVATEALLRWQHPHRGQLLPGSFLELASDIGLTADFDSWMLLSACLEAVTWGSRLHRGLGVWVNLSSRSLADPRLPSTVLRALDASELDPGLLTLEITEGGLMQDAPTTVRTLGALGDLGVQLAIDDFGTGYSSLAYLQQFPVQSLKIDKSFVGRLDQPGPQAQDAAAIVRTIVSLAAGLGLQTVAEGIETPEQLAEVTALGCDLGQGFHLARPAPSELLVASLAGGGPSTAPPAPQSRRDRRATSYAGPRSRVHQP